MDPETSNQTQAINRAADLDGFMLVLVCGNLVFPEICRVCPGNIRYIPMAEKVLKIIWIAVLGFFAMRFTCIVLAWFFDASNCGGFGCSTCKMLFYYNR
ncbi:MAG: hypothetical protein OXF73_02355 [Gammaproteobacteria bacterium]|nr:hypothetical protein [Gammaproteobacteria bacterium]